MTIKNPEISSLLTMKTAPPTTANTDGKVLATTLSKIFPFIFLHQRKRTLWTGVFNYFCPNVRLMPNDYSINPPLRSLRLRIKLGLYTPFLFQKVASTLLAWLNVSLAVVFPSSVA